MARKQTSIQDLFLLERSYFSGISRSTLRRDEAAESGREVIRLGHDRIAELRGTEHEQYWIDLVGQFEQQFSEWEAR
jgi:hypothetical protein